MSYEIEQQIVELNRRIPALRNEITLAKRKRTAVDDAIANREQTLARMEAQLADLRSPVPAASKMIARRG